EFHGACIDRSRARMVGGPFSLFDDKAWRVAPPQIARQGEADRATTDDQNGDFDSRGCHVTTQLRLAALLFGVPRLRGLESLARKSRPRRAAVKAELQTRRLNTKLQTRRLQL